MYLIFDTETTGLPKRWKAPVSDTDNWPRCVQIAWQFHDEMGVCIEHEDYLITPDGFNIPYDAEKIHGISTELAQDKGLPLHEILEKFKHVLSKSKFVVGQNVGFDLNIMACEFYRENITSKLLELPVLDTCTEKTALLCRLPGGRGGKFKLPTLTELYQHLFGKAFKDAHNATADVEATTRCFLELVRRREFTPEQLDVQPDYFRQFSEANPSEILPLGLKHVNLKRASSKINELLQKAEPNDVIENSEYNFELEEANFAHLHNHSQFSVLQSTISVKELVAATAKHNMNAVALTDHANMMGAFHFVKEVKAHNRLINEINTKNKEEGKDVSGHKIKPIVGCEFFVCEDHTNKSLKDYGYQMVLLAKNKNGYQNLVKMASIAYTDGFYYVPRVDKDLIESHKEDLIALTGSTYGIIPNLILNVGEAQAEEEFKWWLATFGNDFYVELNRHKLEDETHVNKVLLGFAKKYNVKIIASNNVYYLDKEDANAHDILLCVKDGEQQATPKGKGRGYRYGFPNEEFYFKSSKEMQELFADLPEAIDNITALVDKIEPFTLAREVLLPEFDIPTEFIDAQDKVDGGKRGENAYLRHLTYEGAKERYVEITDEIKERIDFELKVIENSGYPGYFLIVQDFIRQARTMDVSVGPGRGSAAGSVVAYCTTITNVDPIKYDLLFERFLNPERVSLPDIDIDFDDEGRGRIIDWVVNKYGKENVAQIITYGTMAAKSSIRDTARALDLPLFDADRLAAKLVPDLYLNLGKIFSWAETTLKDNVKGEHVSFWSFRESKSVVQYCLKGVDLDSRNQ